MVHSSIRLKTNSNTKRFVYFLSVFIRNDPDVRIEAIGLELILEWLYAVPQTHHHDEGNEYTNSDFWMKFIRFTQIELVPLVLISIWCFCGCRCLLCLCGIGISLPITFSNKSLCFSITQYKWSAQRADFALIHLFTSHLMSSKQYV